MSSENISDTLILSGKPLPLVSFDSVSTTPSTFQTISWLPNATIPSTPRITIVVVLLLCVPFLFSYIVTCLQYHAARQRKSRQIPPKFPSYVPFLGDALPFLFDSANYVKRATFYAGRATSTCISLAMSEIYLIQDPLSVAAMWKEPLMSSPIFVYTYGLKNIFGMPSASLESYRADTSGSYKKPHPDSMVPPQNRVDFLTHESLVRGLMGPGMKPTFERIQKNIESRMNQMSQADGKSEWAEHSDMLAWFRDVVGGAIIEALFGKRLLELNPTFLADLWDFDNSVPWFAKKFPEFLVPRAYRTRRRLLNGIKTWYAVARKEFKDNMIYPDGNGDPVWGSYLMRERQEILTAIEGHDDDGVAAADLGLIWTSVTNAVPSAMMANLHIWNNTNLLSRVRHELRTKASVSLDTVESALDIDTSALAKLPLLNSIYAETLRCHVQAYVTRCSAHSDVPIGSWWLRKSDVAMVSSHVCHMNETVWNTKGGEHPVKEFWAERFLVDPNDETSGPLQSEIREQMGLNGRRRRLRDEARRGEGDEATKSEVFCDMEGLEGVWIPFGGGFGACPGRNLLKKIMLWSSAYMATHYEVDVLTKKWEMDDSGYGFGTQKPKGRIAFRIKRKSS